MYRRARPALFVFRPRIPARLDPLESIVVHLTGRVKSPRYVNLVQIHEQPVARIFEEST